MNKLFIGSADKTEWLLQCARGGFLLIDDGPIADAFLRRFPTAVLFDPHVHSFNPLHSIDYRRARDFAALLYAISPQGENTLTVRNGKRALTKILLAKPPRLDRMPRPTYLAEEDAVGMVEELLFSPVIRQVFCRPSANQQKVIAKPQRKIVAKLNRADLGDFDALVLGTLLINQYKGTIILPDFGFYALDFHTSLIREDRLIAGIASLSELSPKLQQALLRIADKEGADCTWEDAITLARYARLIPNTVAHTEFVHRLVEG